MLDRLQALEREIKIAIIGIGSVGKGLVLQSEITPGISCLAIADIKIEKAIACAQWLGREYEIVHSVSAMERAISARKLAVTDDGLLLSQCVMADALLEASSAIVEGAEHALTALNHGLHTIMMNYEADLMYGPLLHDLAEARGLVYSACDGDQPATIKRLVDQIRFWGFQLVMAGNIKGYLDRRANPTTIIPEADKRSLDYKMCTSYTDGTKLNIEMAVVANGLGLRTAVPGMLGPRAGHVHEVFDKFDFDALWQSDRVPVVDYVLDARPKGGVFVIGFNDNPFQQYYLDWFPSEMGRAPYYLFYHPYHLGHMEALATLVEAVLDHRPLLAAVHGMRTNVFAYARGPLKKGDKLDGVGGYTCYGLIENIETTDDSQKLPVCLADEVVLQRDIAQDEPIMLADIHFDPCSPAFKLYAEALALRRAPIVHGAS